MRTQNSIPIYSFGPKYWLYYMIYLLIDCIKENIDKFYELLLDKTSKKLKTFKKIKSTQKAQKQIEKYMIKKIKQSFQCLYCMKKDLVTKS
ncbi:hypothetical protein C2G38_2213293 [Gigaspora rosea]|uniref:Uncharacterized protein n=1 Tax=Gigaspora rosea TaxID=44941 RepID=A0A397UF59_9GLOM|nr:hypothetical protein C2G38_2213293 [Gigaspora rosea]